MMTAAAAAAVAAHLERREREDMGEAELETLRAELHQMR
jgi:hypothetical protein